MTLINPYQPPDVSHPTVLNRSQFRWLSAALTVLSVIIALVALADVLDNLLRFQTIADWMDPAASVYLLAVSAVSIRAEFFSRSVACRWLPWLLAVLIPITLLVVYFVVRHWDILFWSYLSDNPHVLLGYSLCPITWLYLPLAIWRNLAAGRHAGTKEEGGA